MSSCSTTTPMVARHDQDLGDPDRDKTAVPMRNELRDREPAVSPAQPPVQDVVSAGEAQASIDAMEKGLPWMAGGYPGAIGVSESRALRRAERDEWSVDIQEAQRRLRRTCHDRTIALPSFPNRRRKGSGSRSVTAPHQVHQIHLPLKVTARHPGRQCSGVSGRGSPYGRPEVWSGGEMSILRHQPTVSGLFICIQDHDRRQRCLRGLPLTERYYPVGLTAAKPFCRIFTRRVLTDSDRRGTQII